MNMRATIRIGLLLFGMSLQAFSHEGEGHTDHELEALVWRIEAIDEGKANVGMDTVDWLMEIISSDYINHHRPFVVSHGREGTSYHPTSSYAIWALSSLIEDPPYTYEDANWEIGANMTGERKRWVEWWAEKKNSVSIRKDAGPTKASSGLLNSEKKRQAANFDLHLEISRKQAAAQARKEYFDYFELEHKMLFGRGSEAAEDSFDLNPKSQNGADESVNETNAKVRRSVSEGKPETSVSSRSPVWPFALGAIALTGIVLVLLRSRKANLDH
jgi:hypothetical protein